jgi:hypothetical protein
LLVARDAARRSRVRLIAGSTAAATLLGGASIGFALNQAEPAPVGLQGAWPDFPPGALSSESFGRLGGNWASWSEAAAMDVAQLYALGDQNLDQQRQALAKVQSRLRVIHKALEDPAYASIRGDLTSIYGALKLRTDLFQTSLDLLSGDTKQPAVAARQAAADEVRNALTALEADLKTIPKGDAWLPYVRANEVRNAIGTPAARDVLSPLPAKLDPNAAGRTPQQTQFLNRPSLRRYATAVNDYLSVARIADEGADPAAVRQALGSLVQAIDNYADQPTDEAAKALRDARAAVKNAAGPAGRPLDDLIRREFLNYNLRLVADAPFLSKLVSAQDINCGPVVDYFMGARIRGTQTTNTNANLVLVPSETDGRFVLTVDGVSNSRTTAVTSEATVNSVGTHQFHAAKPITFDGDQFMLGPVDLSVNPHIRHTGIATKYDNIFFGLFRRAIQRRAFAEANSRLPAGRAHAAEEMRENFIPQFNSQVDQQFGEMNANLASFEDRARRKGVYPQAERVRTTDDRFLLDAAVRNPNELSGSAPNVGSTRGVGFTLQVHQSLMNNTADRWGFAGKTMTDRQVQDALRDWLSDLFGRDIKLEDDNTREPVTLIFAQQDPIRFQVLDGAVVLILNAGIKQEDGSEIPPQHIEIPLNLSVSGDKIVIERGTVTVTTGSIPQRGVIRRRLERSITGGTRDATITIDRPNRSPTYIQVQRIEARAGWLTIYGL